MTPDAWTAEFRLVDDHTDADSTITVGATVTADADGALTVA